MPKQTIVRPTGVVTQPNEYGELPPGTLSVGDGIQIRGQSVIEPRNAFEEITIVDPDYNQAVKLWPRSVGALIVGRKTSDDTTRLFYGQFGGSFGEIAYNGTDHFSFSAGKAHFSDTRERVVITSEQPPAILAKDTIEARQAGIAPLFISEINVTTGGEIWEQTKYIGYAAVLRHIEEDGYVVLGPVSSTLIAQNLASSHRLATVRLTWPTNFNFHAGDVIELYRLPQQDSVDLLGAEYRLAVQYQPTTAEIAAHSVDILDTCLETALSTYLYTNPSQKGFDKSNWMAPPSSDVCTFKSTTFYTSTAVAHQFVTRIPNVWGDLTTADAIAHGIGTRTVTGAFTVGFNTFVVPTIADTAGIVPGQTIASADPGVDNTVVTSVVGQVIQFTGSATVPGSASVDISDMLAIDGISFSIANAERLAAELGLEMSLGGIQTLLFADPALLITGPENVLGQTLTFINAVPPNAFTIAATNGANYSPPIAEYGVATTDSMNDARTNRVHYSEIEQPECVPSANFFYVGSGTILKLWATQDSLFVFCSDGIFRIDGDGDDWSVKPFDPDTILLAPDAISSMNNEIYAFTTAGFITITDSGGVKKVSALLIDEDLRELWNQFTETTPALPYTWGVQIACDKHRSEVWLNFNDYTDGGFVQTWIWNVNTRTFVTQGVETPSALVYVPYNRSMVLGSDALRAYDPDAWMETDIEFNSVYAEDLGVLKQWIDVTLFFEDLSDDVEFLPRFEGEEYVDGYLLAQTSGAFDHVVAPLLTAVHNKHMRFGYEMEAGEGPNPYYKLKGLTYRYRIAAEPLRQ